MILELDAGNSRIKWRHLNQESGTVIAEGLADSPEALLASSAVAARPDMARMCSVRAAAAMEVVRDWVASNWGLELQVATVTRSCGGVTNQYQDVTRMGADRWLAMIAAFNASAGPCLVIDAGTALTLDLVDATGLHLGGYILPGRRLMLSSLEASTMIRLQSQVAAGVEPGNDTETAVINGILASQLALIESAAASLGSQRTPATLFLTGGDAALLSSQPSSCELQLRPSLVLDGLAFVCPIALSSPG